MPWNPGVSDTLRGCRVLVTGHTGFKGVWLAMLLEELGADVCGISLPPTQDSLYAIAGLQSRWDEAFIDIRDARQTAEGINRFRPELVLHLAAQPLVSTGFAAPLETFETNVMGTVHVLEGARSVPSVQACVVVTTDKVYREGHDTRAYLETDPLGGEDPYAASKAAAEHVVSAWRTLFRALDEPKIASVRAGNVIGGGDSAPGRLLPDLIRAFRAGEVATVRSPGATRPWQHVLDPLAGYLEVAARLLTNQTVPDATNFGPPDSLTVSDVAQIASECWGAEAAWQIGPSNTFPEAAHLALDSTLAASVLGWQPRWTSLEAVALTVAWWKKVAAGLDPATACLDDIDELIRP